MRSRELPLTSGEERGRRGQSRTEHETRQVEMGLTPHVEDPHVLPRQRGQEVNHVSPSWQPIKTRRRTMSSIDVKPRETLSVNPAGFGSRSASAVRGRAVQVRRGRTDRAGVARRRAVHEVRSQAGRERGGEEVEPYVGPAVEVVCGSGTVAGQCGETGARRSGRGGGGAQNETAVRR